MEQSSCRIHFRHARAKRYSNALPEFFSLFSLSTSLQPRSTFSFGVLMWELYTCQRPYSDVPEDQIAQRVTLKGLRPTFPPDTPRSYS